MTHSSPSSSAAGRERGQVGPGVGLGEALAPRHLALEDLRQELLLLLLGAPPEDGRPDQGVAEEVGAQRGAGAGELLVEDDLLHGGEPLAAVLLGPRGADPTAPEQLPGPLLVEAGPLGGGHLEVTAGPTRRGRLSSQPGADLDPERLGLGRIGEVHGRSLRAACPTRRPRISRPRPASPGPRPAGRPGAGGPTPGRSG